jgi:hypothetical protein
MEDRLAAALADVHEDAVVLEAGLVGGLCDEVQHPLRLVRRELVDLAEGRDVPLGQNEQVRVGPRVDVADRNEAVGLRNVLALLYELAEEAVLRQRGSPPPKRPRREP